MKTIKELEKAIEKEPNSWDRAQYQILKDVLGLIDERIKELKKAQKEFKRNYLYKKNPIIEAKLTELEKLKAKIKG